MSKILVVDDDYYQRDLYQQVFSDAGFEVIVADDGQDAWEKLDDKPADLVFTGIDMPRMGGFELVKKIREKIEISAIPVIIFSHLGREEDREKAKTLYNAHFMVKGYDNPMKILNTVQEILKDGQSDTAMKPEEKEETESAPVSPPAIEEEDNREGNTSI